MRNKCARFLPLPYALQRCNPIVDSEYRRTRTSDEYSSECVESSQRRKDPDGESTIVAPRWPHQRERLRRDSTCSGGRQIFLRDFRSGVTSHRSREGQTLLRFARSSVRSLFPSAVS